MKRIDCKVFAVVALLVGLVIGAPVPTLAQIATGTIAGRVADDQGGGVPGATVTLVSATRGTTIDGVTNDSGDFVIPNIPRDTYLVRVTMDGFKTVERPNVEVSPGQRVVVPTLTHHGRRPERDGHRHRRSPDDSVADRRAIVHGLGRSDSRAADEQPELVGVYRA